ncbi:uncharacterized protein LOC113353772 [Papaver somniferum]|uniref:uncharacterized protein LOC113353772 n=1 Tax=Papaver somniferum TaxID=3469 RepID=UPI000E6F9B13|nr:uncharacterized protein LOC113353772 [Papaver somniferum]XP_026453055.1 uncharacterized protein LOC113353772 [Papaver somniferum]XP_026453056.1 uncharacterized protein LOC113353772 [Papaver somniferum]
MIGCLNARAQMLSDVQAAQLVVRCLKLMEDLFMGRSLIKYDARLKVGGKKCCYDVSTGAECKLNDTCLAVKTSRFDIHFKHSLSELVASWNGGGPLYQRLEFEEYRRDDQFSSGNRLAQLLSFTHQKSQHLLESHWSPVFFRFFIILVVFTRREFNILV